MSRKQTCWPPISPSTIRIATWLFSVADTYYRLLTALSQQDAARAALADAQTVREAVELRLANGLATLPDALEARAAVAEAAYELASVQGSTETARGDLATVLGASPAAPFRVLDAASMLSIPENTEEPVRTIMDRALAQRPDLLAEAARLRAAEASIKQAHSAFDPVLSFTGSWGHSNAVGQQKGGPEVHSAIYPYQAQLNLTWTVFDGGARKYEVRRARSEAGSAEAQMAATRDQIENEIWSAYTRLKTAQQQLDGGRGAASGGGPILFRDARSLSSRCANFHRRHLGAEGVGAGAGDAPGGSRPGAFEYGGFGVYSRGPHSGSATLNL